MFALSCGARPSVNPGDGGFQTSDTNERADRPLAPCDPRNAADADGDGIADSREGTEDVDEDGMPNFTDTDADGDGIGDRDERGSMNPCITIDNDQDGLPDFLDTDADNDGLSDVDERAAGSNPAVADSDGDSIPDLVEVRGSRTSPIDALSRIDPKDFYVVLRYQDREQLRDLEFGTRLRVADVYFLVDATTSMGRVIANVRDSLGRLATEIRLRIPDAQLGAGRFEDFPTEGGPDGHGERGNLAYRNMQDITADVEAVRTQIAAITEKGGGDAPESSLEALYQTVTGEGGDWTFTTGATGLFIRQRVCPVLPDEFGARRGYPCFRSGALPIVVMVGDAAWHNGPAGAEFPYAGISPAPHTMAQAIEATQAIGARFIGVSVIGSGRPETGAYARAARRAGPEAVARMTGTVDLSGNPLVYDALDGDVSDRVIDGIEQLASGVAQDVTTTRRNVPGNPDEFDATTFITRIVTVEGTNGTVTGPSAGVTYTSKDDNTFFNVIPGTRVTFRVTFKNDVRMSQREAQVFRAQIAVVGNGVSILEIRQVFILVPPKTEPFHII